MTWWLLATLVGCSGGDKDLQNLHGSWAGPALVNGASYMVYATFKYEEFLSGDVMVQEPGGDRYYAVKRAEAFGGTIALDLLETNGGTQSLDLDGSVSEDGKSFAGTITATVQLTGTQPLGWQGTYDLQPAQPFIFPNDTAPPPPPPPPPDTGPDDTGPGDTGLGDTGPGDTGPKDTGPKDTGPGGTGNHTGI